jgi:hypothetical protein
MVSQAEATTGLWHHNLTFTICRHARRAVDNYDVVR